MANINSKIKIEDSILSRAKMEDDNALQTMFKQFLTPGENIVYTGYLGQHGFWWTASDSFVCLTNKRVGAIMTGSFGEFLYHDVLIKDINSSAIYQPSILGLIIIMIIVAISTFGLGLLLSPFIVKFYYKLNKSGAVFVGKLGLSVYAFCNRNRMNKVTEVYRLLMDQSVMK